MHVNKNADKKSHPQQINKDQQHNVNYANVHANNIYADHKEILLHDDAQSCTDRHRFKCPKVKCTVFGETYNILCDTGEELSCMSHELFEKLTQYNKLPELPIIGISIVGATGKKYKIVKKQYFVNMILEDNKEREVSMLVVEGVSLPLILGADFLHEFKATINYQSKQITLIEKNVTSILPYYYDGDSTQSTNLKIKINLPLEKL
jgi:predicted aspartyl protease